MSKAEHSPPFRMTIQNGRLVPAQAWDEERLLTYRNGSSVNVIITQEKNRKLERKYWAILHRVVKTCPVHQKTAEALHKAIRLKLGIVESFTTLGGAIKVELRSTSGMEDQEYSAFFEEAMDLLSAETGVDVQTLTAESSDVGDDEPASDHPPSKSETAGSTSENPTSPGPSDDATDPAMPVEAGAEGQEQSEPAPASEDFTATEWKWLRESGRMLWAFAFTGEIGRVQAAAKSVDVPAYIGQPAKDKLRAFTKLCIEVADGESPGPRRQIAAMHLGVTEDELKGVEP